MAAKSLVSADSFEPKNRRWFETPTGYRWRRQSTITFLVFHLLLPLACVPWLFSWSGVVAAFLGYYLYNSIGVDLCFHRLLSHRSFKTHLWFERTMAILGVCNLQDSPMQWTATHRRHHRHADAEGDPHSPVENFFRGHMGWLLVKENDPTRDALHQRFVADMKRDPFYRSIEANTLWLWIFLLHTAVFTLGSFLCGWAIGGSVQAGVRFGMSMFVWGVVVRVVYSWHATWAVNSFAHWQGYRNYDTKDNSRNNWIVTCFTNGGGWHNNHHGDPRSAAHGHHRWWEIDLVYLTLRLFQAVGLAWDVTPRRRLHLLQENERADRLPLPSPSELPQHRDRKRAA